MNVVLAHDYLTQRGGAERVLLSLQRAFPSAPIYTSLYDPDGTFSEFARADVRPLVLNRLKKLRRSHRLALPLLAPAFQGLRIEADVAICSSSGWAHGACVSGKKIVYCHSPARWLYQSDRYLAEHRIATRLITRALSAPLVRWDKRAARSADVYLANSRSIRDRIWRLYGLQAEVIPPPPAVDPCGPSVPTQCVAPGFFLCIARLLPYKNVSEVVRAFSRVPDLRLVVVGTGPQEDHLRRIAGTNTHFTGAVTDSELRWLYSRCRATVAASYEDFGLTPLEAATFGKPTAALRFGGYLDTIVEGQTGLFFDHPHPEQIAQSVRQLASSPWDAACIRQHAAGFDEKTFVRRITEVAEAVVA